MFSLTARLRLARLALLVPAERADVHELAETMHAGVDLLILEAGDDPERDAATLRTFREQWGRTQLLLAATSPDAGEKAAADVVFVPRPTWLTGTPSRPHEHSLLGRGVRDARNIKAATGKYDFFILGPDAGPHSPVLAAAQEQHPVFDQAALPWFAHTTPRLADGLLECGVRRLAFDAAEVDAGTVKNLAAELKRLWDADPAGFAYVTAAFRR